MATGTSHPQRAVTYGLLRHGETEYNLEKRVQGHGNSPLTPRGRHNVASWCDLLEQGNWEHILASDLDRVGETVAIINHRLRLPVTVDARLREQHWGDWEGLLVNTVHTEHAEELAIQAPRGWDFRPPNGESRREVQERALTALAAFRASHPADRVLVVCHLGVIKCLLYGAAGCSFLAEENIRVEKRCLHYLHYEADGYRLGEINVLLPERPS